MLRPAHQILVAPEPFGLGYDVLVRPTPSGIGHDRQFETAKAARAYAADLGAAMGWSVVDRCEADHGAR